MKNLQIIVEKIEKTLPKKYHIFSVKYYYDERLTIKIEKYKGDEKCKNYQN